MKALTLILTNLSLVCCTSAYAANLMQYTENLPIGLSNQERAALLGVFQQCGSLANIDDHCVISNLKAFQGETGLERAKTLVSQYEETQSLGNSSKPECQLIDHRKANRVVGHCMLVMNYFAIDNQSTEDAINDYKECLTSSMLALTYQGNIVGQYFLIQLYNQDNQSNTANVWTRALKMRQNTEEYETLIKCYGNVSF